MATFGQYSTPKPERVGSGGDAYGRLGGMFGMPAIKVPVKEGTGVNGQEVYDDAKKARNTYAQNVYDLQKSQNNWNGGLQVGKMFGDMMNNIFTHAVNMRQLTNHSKFMWYQHDISKKGLALEDKKLDVTKEMQGEQLKYQLQVARYQKETAVTVAAIQQKGKTKRVQALAALRGFYNHGKPASPFQRVMT